MQVRIETIPYTRPGRQTVHYTVRSELSFLSVHACRHSVHHISECPDFYQQVNVEAKLCRNKLWRLKGGIEFWASILTLTFGTNRTAELSAIRPGHTLRPRKFLDTDLC